MKNYQFLIFFSVVLLIYSAINYYIYHRGMQALASEPTYRIWFRWGFIFLAASYVAGRFLERIQLSAFSDFLVWTGSFWLAIMFYLLLAVILVDIIRLLNGLTGFLPASLTTRQAALTTFLTIGGLVLLLVTAGYINAISPRIKKLNITIAKNAGNLKELNIVMASDIHMGTIIGPRRMTKLVEMINSQNPDIILFAGDIVDEDLAPVVRQNLGSALLGLKAPMGIFGITGNHEYIGGAEAAVKYLQDHGVIILRDSVVRVGDSFYLAGREDRDKPRFSGRPRLEVEELLKNTDKSFPVILLDHQPFNLEKAQAAGADLQLSGHTHHGQLWPLNYITSAIYEVSMGYLKKSDSHFYVSPGFGGWGPPVRIGNRPEIVKITIRFTK
ncbi:MAG: metallophosphoesterase [Bacteroidales bacterium]|nr:metallophosphoesterase [Bacteroidales bacterium]